MPITGKISVIYRSEITKKAVNFSRYVMSWTLIGQSPANQRRHASVSIINGQQQQQQTLNSRSNINDALNVSS